MKVNRKRAYVSKSILNDVEVDSMPGLVRAIGKMIGQNQPSTECVREFDNGLSSASDSDQVWDAALDFAKCLRDAKLDPEPPEPRHRRHPIRPIQILCRLVAEHLVWQT